MTAKNTRRTTTIAAVAVIVAVVATVLDQWSKAWAISALTDQPPRPLLGDFITLRLLFNPGAAFSLGEGVTWIFTAVSVVVVLACLWALATGKVKSLFVGVILGFIIGGALGNLIDRLEIFPHSGPSAGFGRGHVIDFIDYNGWFVGNVADIWVVVGVIVLAVYVLFFAEDDQPTETATEVAVDE